MNSTETFEFKKVTQAEIDLAMKQARLARSEFTFEAVGAIKVWVKSFFQNKQDVQAGSKLAHPC